MIKFAHGWLAQRDIRPGARMRLFCLPHAGSGAAAFHGWKRKLPQSIDVCPILLPGREARMGEAPMQEAEPVADQLFENIAPFLDVPYAIFGHSMGSLLAYLWTVRLMGAGAKLPTVLFVSGREAMHVPLRNPPIHHLDDAGFVQELQWRYAGSQVDLLNDPELREVFLPVLRADIRLVETYRHSEQPLLSFPVAAVSGEDDPNVLDEGLEAWKDLVAADLRIRRFPGDHFYHVGAGEKGLLDEIAARIG